MRKKLTLSVKSRARDRKSGCMSLESGTGASTVSGTPGVSSESSVMAGLEDEGLGGGCAGDFAVSSTVFEGGDSMKT